jgi:hypothetical protein
LIGGAVVVVVVILLLLMIVAASKTAAKAEAILAALEDARDNTAGLWQLDVTNQAAGRIVDAAVVAREHLASKAATP